MVDQSNSDNSCPGGIFLILERNMQNSIMRSLVIIGVITLCALTNVSAHEVDMKVTREVLAAEALANIPGHQLTAVTVEIAPGVVSPPHRHAGFVFIYVLSGTIQSQLNKGEIVEYKAGESWVEPPGTLHSYARNPSESEPVKILAVFVAEQDASLTTPD
ncbi:MAG: quercetin dioxygenase-like cupin family protein [Gammaproteobacteria bacterium]